MTICSKCRQKIEDTEVSFEIPDGTVYFYHEECKPAPLTKSEQNYFYAAIDKWIKQLEDTGRIGLADTMCELLWRVMFQLSEINKS